MAHVYYRLLITKAGTIAGGTTTGYYPCVGEWVSYDSGGSVISLSGATFSASSTVGGPYVAGSAFDADESTMWHANFVPSSGSPEWLRIQFPSPVAIDHFSLTTGSGRQGQGVDTFALQYSDDGATWHDVFWYQGPQWGSSEGPQMFYTTGAVYRINASANDYTSGGIGLADLKFFDSGASQIATSTGTPLSSLANGSQTPDLAFDSNSSTHYYSSDSVSSGLHIIIGFHFPTDPSPASFSITAENFSNQHVFAPQDFVFEKSTDGSNWTTLATFTGVHWASDGQTQPFSLSGGAGTAAPPCLFVVT